MARALVKTCFVRVFNVRGVGFPVILVRVGNGYAKAEVTCGAKFMVDRIVLLACCLGASLRVKL